MPRQLLVCVAAALFAATGALAQDAAPRAPNADAAAPAVTDAAPTASHQPQSTPTPGPTTDGARTTAPLADADRSTNAGQGAPAPEAAGGQPPRPATVQTEQPAPAAGTTTPAEAVTPAAEPGAPAPAGATASGSGATQPAPADETPAATQAVAPPADAAPPTTPNVPPSDRASLRPLTVGLLRNTPPFSSSERYGIRAGFDVDLGYAVCGRLNRRCRFVPMDRDGLMEALRDRRLDMVVASDGRSERLDTLASFSEPYLTLSARFVLPKVGSSDLEASEALPYGAVVGTPYAQFLTATYKRPGEVALYSSAEEMWIDLALGRLQGALATAVTARTEFLNTPLGRDFRFSTSAVTDDNVRAQQAAIAVRKGDTELLAEVNAALHDFMRSPEYAEALTRHLSGGLARRPGRDSKS